MSERDWGKELAKIDRQLESISDKALLPAEPAATPAAKAKASADVEVKRAATTTLGVMLRLVLATALGVGVLFWPYAARCGAGLAGYLAAVGVVAVAGGWSAVWSWRHRAGRAHLLSLLLVLWGLSLAAVEVLPRVGYAKADPARSVWVCD